jgi:hypothetical protein
MSSNCFVCNDPPNLVGNQFGLIDVCRFACLEHIKQALLSNGEKLYTFLERQLDKSHPFEGSGLNVIVNPVTIQGKRGWCDFFMAGPAILEEVYPSETYFDFFAQHIELVQPFFHAIYQKRDQIDGPKNYLPVIAAIYSEHSGIDDQINALDFIWSSQYAIANELAQRNLSFVQTPEQAAEVFHSTTDMRTTDKGNNQDQFFRMIDRLLELGETRFT